MFSHKMFRKNFKNIKAFFTKLVILLISILFLNGPKINHLSLLVVYQNNYRADLHQIHCVFSISIKEVRGEVSIRGTGLSITTRIPANYSEAFLVQTFQLRTKVCPCASCKKNIFDWEI